jgi:hypothetical protein
VESIDSTEPGGGITTLALTKRVDILDEEDEDQKDFARLSNEYSMVASSSSREKRERKVRRLKVKGAGLQEVNGLYHCTGKFANGYLFAKETPLGKVYIRRQGEEAGALNWRITLSASSRDGMHLYKRDQVPAEQTVPPVLGWEVCSSADGVAEAHASKLGKPPEKLDVFHMVPSMLNVRGSQVNDMLRPLQLEDNTVELDLEVGIIRATGVRNADWMGASDPYCMCVIPGKEPPLGKSRLKTKVITDDLNPVWNFRDVMPGYKVGDNLQFKVFDEDLAADELLGLAQLPHERFYPDGFTGELSLTDLKGNEAEGTLTVAIHVIKVRVGPRGRTETKKRRFCQHVQVAIISASGLAHVDEEGDCDPYCVCRIPGKSPEDDGNPRRSMRSMRSKGSKASSQALSAVDGCQIESHVVPRTRFPTWRYTEEMTGYVEGDDLLFSVWDRDYGKDDDFLAHVTLKGDKILPNGFVGELQLLDEKDSPLDARLNICIIAPYREVPGIRCRLDTREGKLGVKIVPDEAGDAFFIRKVFEEGLVDKWNAANPEQRVLVDDRVVEVNGVRGSAKELMSTAAVCKGEMEWLVMRTIV